MIITLSDKINTYMENINSKKGYHRKIYTKSSYTGTMEVFETTGRDSNVLRASINITGRSEGRSNIL